MRRTSFIVLLAIIPYFAFATTGNFCPVVQLKPIKRVKPEYPRGAQIIGSSACMTFMFTVTAEGKTTGIRLANAYPSLRDLGRLGFFNSGRQALSQWQFAPPEASTVMATQVSHVFQEFIYILGRDHTNQHIQALHATTGWLCSNPLFPAMPIKIVGSTGADASMATSGAWSAAKDSRLTARYTLALDPDLTRKAGKIEETTIEANYCVDPKGRLANVVMLDGSSEAQNTARLILNELDYSARTLEGTALWTCGLHTQIKFSEQPEEGYLGIIERSWFNELTAQPQMPKFLSATPPKLQVMIPRDAHLPPKATIEVRFCISAGGKPYNLKVTHANPPEIFNQAALKTVAGWQFDSTDHAVCDVYQKVAFNIPRQGDH